MLKIAICDDEIHFCDILKEIVSQYLFESGFVFQIDVFNSGKQFVALGIEMLQYSILFLDINLDEISGIAIAKKIREIDKEMSIVFVTAHTDYTLEGYKVNATRYLLKRSANIRFAIDECMDAIVEKMNCSIVRKKFVFREGIRDISLNRLLYIESNLHKLEFHVMEDILKTYTMYDTLNNIDSELIGCGFVRIHQSYLVNLKYIESIAKYKAILTNGMELIISRTRYTYVKDKLMTCQGKFG